VEHPRWAVPGSEGMRKLDMNGTRVRVTVLGESLLIIYSELSWRPVMETNGILAT
jgi:hypothetical protein